LLSREQRHCLCSVSGSWGSSKRSEQFFATGETVDPYGLAVLTLYDHHRIVSNPKRLALSLVEGNREGHLHLPDVLQQLLSCGIHGNANHIRAFVYDIIQD